MNPDTPALRGLLHAIDGKLAIPTAVHHSDDDLELVALRAAAHDVQLAVRALLGGPLDNCAIQSWGHVLDGHPVPVRYQTTDSAA